MSEDEKDIDIESDVSNRILNGHILCSKLNFIEFMRFTA